MSWDEVDRLAGEQQIKRALERAEELLAAARAAGDEENWTRGLITVTQLTTALHGYETAVRRLTAEPWPEEPLWRTVLALYRGRTLVNYLQAYSWEIRQREQVDSDGEVDLEVWTAERIALEAQRAYLEAWHERQAWGAESLGRLGEYLEQNTYPARIRGTLRDAVSYLFAELLADRALWSPAQENGLWRLDLPELIAGPPAADGSSGGGGEGVVDPASETAHPLTKAAAVLADLERWHRAQQRPEAAFEARRQRLELLWRAFGRDEDRQLVRADLERAIGDLGRRYPWWSLGAATLAEWTREGDRPDALVEARRLALEAARAHPDSVGGQRGRHLVATIEAPGYQLSSMATDGPRRRSLAVQHKNIESLHFRAWRLELAEVVAGVKDANLLPSQREVDRITAGRSPDHAWTTELAPTPDYRLHRTYVTPPFGGPGLYLVVASVRADFAERGNQKSAVNLVVSDLVLVERQVDTAHEVTVRSGASGEPLAGVAVQLYRYDWRRGHRLIETRDSAGDGRVVFSTAKWERNSHFLLARKGAEVTVDPRHLGPVYEPRDDERTAALVYTDRSVYRPGQELLWKLVAYRGDAADGRYRTLAGSRVTVELLDANYQTVASAEVESNDFGSASGAFTVPAGRVLGTWRLRASLGGETPVQVEEYKRPTFEVTLAPPTSPPRLNRELELGGEARYYFGLPVTEGKVSWRVTREPLYPPWWGWWRPRPVEVEMVAGGDAALDPDGRFEVTFVAEADERLADDAGIGYRFRLAAEVTAEGGETRSAEEVFRLGFVAVEAEIGEAAEFFVAGEPVRLAVRRRDLNGAPAPGAASWRLVAIEQPAETPLPAEVPLPLPDDGGYRTAGDRLRPRWDTGVPIEQILAGWDDGAQVAAGRLAHGGDGEAAIELGALAPGLYRLRYRTEDAFGAVFELDETLVVAPAGGGGGGGEAAIRLPALLLAERPSVPVGGRARLLVHSGLDEQPLVLEIARAGRRVERRVLASGSGPHLVEIPIEAEDRGGFGVTLSTLADYQLMVETAAVFVPWDDRRLSIALESFRDRLRPGTEETFRITVTGADEETLAAGAAELLAYMYDRSLDLFAPHQPPDPLALYPTRTTPVHVTSNLGSANEVWRRGRDLFRLPDYPQLVGDRLVFLDSYGIGGPGARFGKRRMAMAQAMPAPPPEAVMQESMEVASAAPLLDADQAADGQGGDQPPGSEEPVALREEFSETAFWRPHLVTGADGSVTVEFTVPDSVTEWNLWVHALTRDLMAGSLTERTRSVKELLVRPYLPRFLREGDRAVIEVVVNNAGDEALTGTVDLDILDPETDASLSADFGLTPQTSRGRAFRVKPGGGTTLAFPLSAPPRVGATAFKVVARAGSFSDGELRPLPVLPGRYHLTQSRFAALTEVGSRTLSFPALAADDDPTRIDEQLVVTLDAQLFASVLAALPYLVDYPYDCTEQTLNRFVATGILDRLYRDYPAVSALARDLATRETRYEAWNADDPNRKLALEETPWLVTAQGGETDHDLLRILDPEVAAAQRAAALAELERAQTAIGGFPWWPGGPPSPHMTAYILYGFSKALELGVEVPQEPIQRAWSYLQRHYASEMVDRILAGEDCCWQLVTYLNYVLSSYPDPSWTGGVFSADDRARMLDYSFEHWREHPPLLKGYLTLTLARADRAEDARKVWASVMDSAETDPELGTYWAPEDRAWLWYNDTIEGHAFALRTLTELDPDDPRRHGLVHWLFLNKQLNHWKSTRATAEVLTALVHYLEQEETLGVPEAATVTVGPRRERFVFAPERFTGKDNQLVIPGEEVTPAMAEVVVAKESRPLMFASATWHFSTEQLPAEAEGDLFAVTRRYFRRSNDGERWRLTPLEEGDPLAVGDQVEVQLSITARHAAEYVHLRDPRGAGFEPETLTSGYRYQLGLGYYEEVRDSGANFFFDWLPAGEYTFKYRLRANLAGTFRIGPATLQSMYAPEFTGYSAGAVVEIEKSK